jgi:hypothetical protein
VDELDDVLLSSKSLQDPSLSLKGDSPIVFIPRPEDTVELQGDSTAGMGVHGAKDQ